MHAALKLFGIGAGGCLVALALVPWQLGGTVPDSEIAASVRRSSGLSMRVGGPVTLKLLPRPRVQMTDVSLVDGRGLVAADAPVVYGDLDIPELFKGRWRLISATLADPTVTFDADRVRAHDAAASRADGDPGESVLADPRSFKLSFRSGVIRVRSAQSASDTLLTDVNATAHLGPAAAGSLALSGSAVWHAAPEQFTVWIGQPRAMLAHGSSAASLQITSPLASFSAAGELSGGPQEQFAGRVGLSSNAVPRLFSALGLKAPWPGLRRASLSADALAKPGDLSLSGSTLRLDGTTFEGTLGFHTDSGPGLIEGTLATNFLDLDRLGSSMNWDTAAELYRKPFTDGLLPPNVDLRVSAGVTRWKKAELQDAAMSAFSHDGRIEITLDEAGAFNGTLKAHAAASIGAEGIDLRADLAVSDVEIGPLSAALSGQERATGTLSGKLAVDGRGRSLNDVVHNLSGEGQAGIKSGNFMGLSVTQALKRFTRKLPPSTDQAAQITAFDSASSSIRVADGVLELFDGRVSGPGIQLLFGGRTDLPRGRVDIQAVAAQTDAGGSPVPNGPRLPFEMRGTWGEPMRLVERTRGLSLPALSVPAVDSGAALP